MLAERALQYVKAGDVVGLGSGRAAARFMVALAGAVRGGLAIRGVPTSLATAKLAEELKIPLVDFDQVSQIDVTVDGADEVDPRLNLIKGLGGALVREKIVAAASARIIILVGEEKLVPTLGSRGILPVEIVPFGVPLCRRRLHDLDCIATIRITQGNPYRSDNGNLILDCQIKPIDDPRALEQAILSIPGVVGTGLFLDMADTVLIERGESIEAMDGVRSNRSS